MGVWVSWWLSRWMVECGRGSGCSTCFVLLFSGHMVVSPLSLSTSINTTAAVYRHFLYCCITWWVGGSLRGRYCCCTTFCCTAVSGWVDRSVAVVVCSCRLVHGFVGYFFFCFSSFFFLPLCRPRAGIVQRTTSTLYIAIK